MGFFTTEIETLNDLFVHTLKDIYWPLKMLKSRTVIPSRSGAAVL